MQLVEVGQLDVGARVSRYLDGLLESLGSLTLHVGFVTFGHGSFSPSGNGASLPKKVIAFLS
jgi:hypothetical protein